MKNSYIKCECTLINEYEVTLPCFALATGDLSPKRHRKIALNFCTILLFVVVMLNADVGLGRLIPIVETTKLECFCMKQPVLVHPCTVKTEYQFFLCNFFKPFFINYQLCVSRAYHLHSTTWNNISTRNISECRIFRKIVWYKGFLQFNVHVESRVEGGGFCRCFQRKSRLSGVDQQQPRWALFPWPLHTGAPRYSKSAPWLATGNRSCRYRWRLQRGASRWKGLASG